MSRILITYASHYGQTRKIAERIADRLGSGKHEIRLANLSGVAGEVPGPDDFDVVVLGSRIEAEKHASELVAYVRRYRPALQTRPTAFFSVSMSAATPNAGVDPNGYVAAFCKQSQWEPTIRQAFAGALPYLEYGFFTRWMMKAISRRTHRPTDTSQNHEFTNWTDVDAFALAIDSLSPRGAATRGGHDEDRHRQ